MLTITHVSGPLIKATTTSSDPKAPTQRTPKMLETCYIGNTKLLGEVIAINGDECSIQVYEDTTGLQVGEPVELRDELLSVELGPGLLANMFDGIQRPLEALDQASPVFIKSGIHLPSLDRTKKWDFVATASVGEYIKPGSKLGYVQETVLLQHHILVPQGIEGTLKVIRNGSFTIIDSVATVDVADGKSVEVTMLQKWPVKIARPITKKIVPEKVFKTGQRVIDAMFPILFGAPVSTPGPFGAGKTFTQQQLAKWSNAQIVVYVGCGERGNEMTEMVKLFPELEDPKSGRPLMERTVLIANTSNMPIAAREASIYTGITIAEYFRDMGYDVVLMADSTSRWAEAMREISARLGEMPSEEGYPAYLSSRIAAFYERAGKVMTLNEEEGSVTALGTVSPAGGNFSEPVTQTSLKNTRVFLALDAGLSQQRHYPAINWRTSYSQYEQKFSEIIPINYPQGQQFIDDRLIAKRILAREEKLEEMVKLVGMDGLSNVDRLNLEIAKSLREDFLQQNGFDEIDTYCAFDKTMIMMKTIIGTFRRMEEVIERYPDNETLVSDFFQGEVKSLLSNLKYQKTAEGVVECEAKLMTIIESTFNM
jgi:V/A-type H+-transporting ATPase subunit A